MNDTINSGFSIVFMVVVSLAILAIVAAPVMAKDCDMSMGIQCTEEYYTTDETFENCGSFYNSEPGTINYRMTLKVYDPSGRVVDSAEFSDEGYFSSVRHCLRTSPPEGRWEPGIYKFSNSVFAYNSYGCTYSGSGECTVTVLPDEPDLVITDVWNNNSTVYYKIKNVGGRKAESIKTSLTADGIFKTSDSVATVYSMKEITESFDYVWNCTDRNDTVEICADYANDITEYDETNNCRTETLWCAPCIWVDPTSIDVTLPPHIVSDYTLTIGNSGNGAFTFNITDVSGISPQPGWPTTTGDWVASSPALGDIDGDGYPEVVVGSTDGMVYAWHHDGSNVTGWPKRTGDDVWSSPALGDIDGDGDIEVVVGSLDDKVYAWHHDGSTVAGWPKKTGDGVKSSPALGDIDEDGDIEVVVGSDDNRVYVYCSRAYNPNNIEWGTFHHDVMHTGLYEAMPSKKIDWLSEYPTTGTVGPDSQTDVTITFNTTGLDVGEYHANITITSNDPDENLVIIPVRLTVTSTPTQKGDLNNDDQITPADVRVALQLAATGAHNPAADMNGDGCITSIDALMILEAAAGGIAL